MNRIAVVYAFKKSGVSLRRLRVYNKLPIRKRGHYRIRAAIAGEEISDIDLFTPNKESAKTGANAMAAQMGRQGHPCHIHETKYAYTVLAKPYPIQFKDDQDWLANTRFRVTDTGRLDTVAKCCCSTPTWPNGKPESTI